MPGPNTKYETLARDAAERIGRAAEAGEQLTFLPDEPQAGDGDRAKRGKGKALTQMREWLAAKGYRLPEDVLSEMAGLSSSADAVTEAMAKAERILTWAQDGATGYKGSPVAPSMQQRLAVFMQVFTVQLRAAEAMLPFGAPKATPDVNVSQVTQIVMPAAPTVPVDRGAAARDITPQARRMAPPPMPSETKQNQGLTEVVADASDAESRTE